MLVPQMAPFSDDVFIAAVGSAAELRALEMLPAHAISPSFLAVRLLAAEAS